MCDPSGPPYLADVDIVLRLTQVPSWHLDYPNICSQSTGTSLFSIVLYVPYVWEISVTSAGGDRGEGWQTIGCHGYTLTCTQCSLFAYYLHFSQLAMYMQCSYMTHSDREAERGSRGRRVGQFLDTVNSTFLQDGSELEYPGCQRLF